jgi:putative chitobiose transport system permease protein
LIVFFFIPFFQTLGLSFYDYSSSLYEPSFAGIDNYTKLFKEPIFYKVMFNTFLYLVIAVPFLVIFPLFVAILINQKIRGITLYKILIYFPVIVSIVVAAIAFKWLYSGQGILNYLLSLLNIQPIGWLTDTSWALFSVAVVTIWKGIGYYMMIYLASLMSVPQELYEACDIDGANFLTKHLTVTIPHIMPTIALVSTISTISAMKVFAEIYVMTKGGPLNSTKTIVYYIYERAFENLDLGYASALAVVLLIIVMIFSLINIFCFEKNKYGDI